MIKKSVHTYFEDYRQKANGGFLNKKDLGRSYALSLEQARKQFPINELVTNQYGKELLIDQYKLPFNSVKVILDQFNDINPEFWAFTKIYAYSIQEEPFLHIDGDVFIWDRIPTHKLETDFLFQNKEHLKDHVGYQVKLEEAKLFPKVDFEVLNSNPTWALNCGVVGTNRLDIIKEWYDIVYVYLFDQDNQTVWQTIKDKHSHNHLFEQYFISSIIKNKLLNHKCATLLADDFYRSAKEDFKYTHLWGEAKRKPETMIKVKNRLYKDYPQYKDIFETQETHSEIFDDIYKNELWGKGQGSGGGSSEEITIEYRKFLQQFLKDNKIKSVVDLGCGDWQFSKLIDWSGINYLGLDCVEKIINQNKKSFITDSNNLNFVYSEAQNVPNFSADLLIVKDVLIHWTNQEVSNFLNKLRSSTYKYILITNQVNKGKKLEEISTGEFRSLDINENPFNINAKEIFIWNNDNKITYLIDNIK